MSLSVSIIVPVYNEADYLNHLVRELEKIEGYDEVVIVDASDSPESKVITAAAIRSLEQSNGETRIRFVRTADRGRAAQMNFGARQTETDVLLFLHCDTILPENAIKLVQQVICSGVEWGRFDVNLAADGMLFRFIERMINIRSRVRSIGTGDQAMFVKRSVFEFCGGYPLIPIMEDIALSKCLGRRSRPGLVRSPVITSARRWQNTGPVRTILLMWKLRFLFWIGISPDRLAGMYKDER